MGRPLTPKTVINYTALAIIVFIAYKYFAGGGHQKTADPFRDELGDHPKNIHNPGDPEVAAVNDVEKVKEDETADVGGPRVDVGDLPKDLGAEDYNDDLLNQRRKKQLREQLGQRMENGVNAGGGGGGGGRGGRDQKKPRKNDRFSEDGVDWEVEEEMTKRRAAFFKRLKEKEEILEEGQFKDMHEADDDFTFVTAGSHSTYPATIQFIYSIQYFYPNSKIGIYDIGLTTDETNFINSLCNTEVMTMWLQLWPEALYKIRHRVWRPLLLQFANAKYGHFVYVEPGRFVFRQGIKDYLKQSRIHGVTVGGRQLKYSSYIVTNPHMYTFITIEEKKLQKTPHFDFTMLIIHNTKRVKHYFMRYLISCTLEEYCISPPGAKPSCDLNLGSTKRYANCHRYDESAINLILNKWHNYTPREYLMRDLITKHYDGKDMTKRVKVCNNKKDEV